MESVFRAACSMQQLISNKQRYYDELCCSAFDGTFPAVDAVGHCKYRGPNKTACAVGIKMTDEEAKACEGQTCLGIREETMKRLRKETGCNLDELRQIQRVHDKFAGGRFGKEWRPDRVIWALNLLPVFEYVKQLEAEDLKGK